MQNRGHGGLTVCAKQNILHLCFETMVLFCSNIPEIVKKINNFQSF